MAAPSRVGSKATSQRIMQIPVADVDHGNATATATARPSAIRKKKERSKRAATYSTVIRRVLMIFQESAVALAVQYQLEVRPFKAKPA
jgi:hypothetical protein